MDEKIEVSVVITAYNEEKSIVPLYIQLKPVLNKLKKRYEIIFIDDGSSDGTFKAIEKIQKSDNTVNVVSFQRNFGKAEALSAGFDVSRGEVIITMDADIQDDPCEIPRFLHKISEGYDLVVGWRYKRNDTFIKKLPSKIFNILVRVLTNVKLHDSDCNFRALKRRFIQKIHLYSGLYRYIPSLAVSKGFSVTEIKVTHHKRKFGKSKYGILRLFSGFFDLLTITFLITYRKRPLHLFGGIGVFLTSIGSVIALYLVFIRLFLHQLIGNRPLLLLAVLFIVLGIQFFSIGLIGEMVVSTSKEKGYIIKNQQ